MAHTAAHLNAESIWWWQCNEWMLDIKKKYIKIPDPPPSPSLINLNGLCGRVPPACHSHPAHTATCALCVSGVCSIVQVWPSNHVITTVIGLQPWPLQLSLSTLSGLRHRPLLSPFDGPQQSFFTPGPSVVPWNVEGRRTEVTIGLWVKRSWQVLGGYVDCTWNNIVSTVSRNCWTWWTVVFPGLIQIWPCFGMRLSFFQRLWPTPAVNKTEAKQWWFRLGVRQIRIFNFSSFFFGVFVLL